MLAGGEMSRRNPDFWCRGPSGVGGGDHQGLCVLSCRGSERYNLCCHPAAGPMG